jgi:ATP-binding cassette subfamily F protein 3
MDEPTTHLDIPSTEALLDALRQFSGTIVLISHDVFFIRHLANHVVHIRDGRLTSYPGGYDYYVEKTGWRPDAAVAGEPAPRSGGLPPKSGRGQARREQRRMEAEERQRLSRQRGELRTRVDTLEREIHALERRQAELARAMEDPLTYSSGQLAVDISREFAENKDRLENLNARWEEGAMQLENLSAEPEG